MPLNVTSSKDVEGKPGIVDYNRSDEEDLETALEVIHIDSTKTNATNFSQLNHSPDGGRKSESLQQTATDTKDKKTKWAKLKKGISQSRKSLGSRLKPGGQRNKVIVQEICILPSTGLNGECFGEEEKKEEEDENEEAGRRARGGRRRKEKGGGGGRKRRDSDDSLVFASRIDSATSTASRSSLQPTPGGDSSSATVNDASLVIYDADYDGRL